MVQKERFPTSTAALRRLFKLNKHPLKSSTLLFVPRGKVAQKMNMQKWAIIICISIVVFSRHFMQLDQEGYF